MSVQLYSLTLQRPSAVTSCAVGQFAGKNAQDVIVAKGSWLELWQVDLYTGAVTTVLSYNCFGIIRNIAPFRIAGASKDNLIVASDSGKIAILEYKPEKNTFEQIHLEPYGKTGIRRIVPGQYLAVDPKGRAALIASVEKNKLVYVLNRDSEANITISSPLEAHTPRTLVYAIVGMDVGYDNPAFAALEVDYSDAEKGNGPEKKLTCYELDLGLNHVIKKWSETVDFSSTMLFQVPGGVNGPSGVLVCSEGYVSYTGPDRQTLRVPIPVRKSVLNSMEQPQPVTIVSGVMHRQGKHKFFFLLQSNYGDLYMINFPGDQTYDEMRIKYFDSIPVCNKIAILKSGYIIGMCEGGNLIVYRVDHLGDVGEEPAISSRDDVKPEDLAFVPRKMLNIAPVDEMQCSNPTMDADVAVHSATDELPQIHTLAGQGTKSSFLSLQQGVQVEEVVSSELPAAPLAVWTTKITREDQYDRYIVLAFSNETLVLRIGEQVEEVTDSGILTSVSTLAVQQLGVDGLLQIHSGGIRHIGPDKKVSEWTPPKGTEVLTASTNNFQVVVGLSSSEVVYFEVDEDGQLNEYEERKEIPGGINCLSLGDVPEGRLRSSFLAIGCANSTVRVLSLELGTTLEPLSVQALTAAPSDIRVCHMKGSDAEPSLPYLHIGLHTGVYIVSILDPVSGQLSDTRTRFLGPKSVKVFKAKVVNHDTVLCLSTKPWIGFVSGQSFEMAPLSLSGLTYAWAFSSEDFPQAVIGVEGSNLRIFTVERLDDRMRRQAIRLRHTPRKMARSKYSHHYYIIETDNNTTPPSDEDYNLDHGYERIVGKWASAIQVVDPISQTVASTTQLDNNEAAFSICTCSFINQNDQEYLIVGVSKDQVMLPKSSSGGFIHVYKFSEDGSQVDLVHKTPVEEAPLSMMEFQGRLAVGVANNLRIYDIGLKQLLRKAEVKLPINNIMTLSTQGNRIIVGDIRESLTYVVYKSAENILVPFSDDAIPRHITCSTMLDYDTTIAGDRFGNIFILRCPEEASKMSDEDEHAVLVRSQIPELNGATAAKNKLELQSHYYIQDIPTSLTRAQLVVGGGEVVIYTGVQGTIGALIPFIAKSDVNFFQQLESLMRQEDQPIAGRDHMIYRSYYAPVKNTIDGDLCERFSLIPPERQDAIANELDRTVRDVSAPSNHPGSLLLTNLLGRKKNRRHENPKCILI